MSISRSLHPPAGGDHPADGRRPAARRRRLCSAADRLAAGRRSADHRASGAPLPGASPATVATALAQPLERQLGDHSRHHRDGLLQRHGRHPDRHPVRSGEGHRRPRPARCRRRSTRPVPTCRRLCAGRPGTTRPIPPRLRGDRAGPDLRHCSARRGLRLRRQRAVAESCRNFRAWRGSTISGAERSAVRVQVSPGASPT